MFFVLLGIILITSVKSQTEVTCGSVLKLYNTRYKAYLHSHDVQYASGSKMQSVTGQRDGLDSNSYWQIQNKTGSECIRGVPIKCGNVIRLRHLASSKHLHSHNINSPFSSKAQEVACFGGQDHGDDWIVTCDYEWNLDTPVKLKHVDTSAYLAVTGNVYNEPIEGQYEVAAGNLKALQWKASEGVYIHRSEPVKNSQFHTEL